MELPLPVIDHLLEHWPVARLATLDRAGHPVQVPIVFVAHAGVLWSPIDGKPKRSAALARVRNVERDSRVSVILDHYDADWTRLWWLQLDGHAEVVTSREPASDPVLAPVVEALQVKYDQYQRPRGRRAGVALFRDEPTLLRVAVKNHTSWCASAEALPAEERDE